MRLTARGEAAAVIAAAVPVAGLLAADGRYRPAAVAVCIALGAVFVLLAGWRSDPIQREYEELVKEAARSNAT